MKHRIKRAIRRRRRKSVSNSEETRSVPSHLSSPSPEMADNRDTRRGPKFSDPVNPGEEADTEGYFDGTTRVRDFQLGPSSSKSPDQGSAVDADSLDLDRQIERKDTKDSKKRARKNKKSKRAVRKYMSAPEPPPMHVTFDEPEELDIAPPLTPTNSRKYTTSWRPGLPKLLSSNVFVDPPPSQQQGRPTLAKASSLPDLNRARIIIPGRGLRASRLKAAPPPAAHDPESEDEEPQEMSRTTAVVMLLISTGLVALCAEFLVDAIPAMTASSSISSEFIGLIILPIVGNAAEHVTAVTVAMKNKMDLSIGVAVGSSIQIALFVTPLVVILGWITNHAMSLYFTLFETICLFVTTFVVNFLVLDGKSNYLEGILLIASYILIALSAYFFPNADGQSSLGGSDG
jgi:Ca2+:H+ antiporter